MKIKGIIFDCDGTLVESEHVHLQAWKMALQKRGFELQEEFFYTLAGQPAEAISEKLYELIKVDCPEAIASDKRFFYRQLQKTGVVPISRTIAFLKELKKYDLKLAVASAAPKNEIMVSLNLAEIENDFHHIISGVEDLIHIQDPEGVNKPKPYIYLHTAQVLGLQPNECVAFEDTFFGVKSAKTAGLKTIAVPNIYTKLQDFSQADQIIHHDQPISLDMIL